MKPIFMTIYNFKKFYEIRFCIQLLTTGKGFNPLPNNMYNFKVIQLRELPLWIEKEKNTHWGEVLTVFQEQQVYQGAWKTVIYTI